jgi:hypothetical protein
MTTPMRTNPKNTPPIDRPMINPMFWYWGSGMTVLLEAWWWDDEGE